MISSIKTDCLYWYFSFLSSLAADHASVVGNTANALSLTYAAHTYAAHMYAAHTYAAHTNAAHTYAVHMYAERIESLAEDILSVCLKWA